MADILIIGANGYCGRLIARYLLTHPERQNFTVALAVRSKSKLSAFKLPIDDSVKIFELDVHDFVPLEAAVKQVKVVINAAGPYWRYGSPVVIACARNGVHYVDITGETAWIYRIIRHFDYLASQNHAIIIPSCGVDSLPSDAVVHLANKTLKAARRDAQIDTSVTAAQLSGGIGGGTISTSVVRIEEISPNFLELAEKDWSLSPVVGKSVPNQRMVYKLPSPGPSSPMYGAIWPMAAINRAIVQRTWGLREYARHYAAVPPLDANEASYGPAFTYEEFYPTRSAIVAFAMSVAMMFGSWCLTVAPIRWLFKRLVTQPGNGPAESTLDNGFMHFVNITTSTETPPTYVKTTMAGTGDPGFILTAIMVSESALAILLQKDQLPALAARGGVLTPMTALGDVVLTRLQSTGRFDYSSMVVDKNQAEGKKTR
ncbi:NAD-P-binding protein [Artomyces pyxidatus]|uniref:NAD-P-binding protein n=1 Tax=Artomyces pyxidatus TaxID=48021 RepID=A0ACB8T1C2_9AGAM|nr:NAD-P-binding protein [Artomyces pyxidatus]